MANQETFTIDGKEMKRCPGWKGNDFYCGRGDPRLIPVAKDVCEGCSRGMRKRGQATRAEEEQRRDQETKRIREAERAAAVIVERIGAPLTDEQKSFLSDVVKARARLTRSDVEGRDAGGYYGSGRIYGPAKEDVLYVLAGLELPLPSEQ